MLKNCFEWCPWPLVFAWKYWCLSKLDSQKIQEFAARTHSILANWCFSSLDARKFDACLYSLNCTVSISCSQTSVEVCSGVSARDSNDAICMPMSLDFQEVEKVVKNSGGENQASNLGQTRAYLHRGGYRGVRSPSVYLPQIFFIETFFAVTI